MNRRKKNNINKYKKRRIILVLCILIITATCVYIVLSNSNTINTSIGIRNKKQVIAVFPEEVYGVKVNTELVDEESKGRPRDKARNKIYCIT